MIALFTSRLVPMSEGAFLGGLGIGELILILVIVLIIFGAGKLPQIGDVLGKGIRNFRKESRNPDAGEKELEVSPRRELPEASDIPAEQVRAVEPEHAPRSSD